MAVTAPKKSFKNPVSCASAFGRFFYAVDSTVYFTQIAETDSDTGRCYQQNDPTSTEFPDLLDTDGGVIELEDTQRIKAMQPYSSGVLIFAGNGVWYIYNPDDPTNPNNPDGGGGIPPFIVDFNFTYG